MLGVEVVDSQTSFDIEKSIKFLKSKEKTHSKDFFPAFQLGIIGEPIVPKLQGAISIYDVFANLAAKSPRWNGKPLKTNGQIGTVADHSFLSYKLAETFELSEEVKLALLFHDLCETLEGREDISVGTVNETRIKFCTAIADKLSLVGAEKDRFVKELLNAFKNKTISLENFFLKFPKLEKPCLEKAFTDAGILRDKIFFDIVIEAKELEDKSGELSVRDAILTSLEGRFPMDVECKKKSLVVISALSMVGRSDVSFVEKIETGVSFLLGNRSDLLIGFLLNNVGSGITSDGIGNSFRQKINYSWTKLQKCLEDSVIVKDIDLMKKFYIMQNCILDMFLDTYMNLINSTIEDEILKNGALMLVKTVHIEFKEKIKSCYREKCPDEAIVDPESEEYKLGESAFREFVEYKEILNLEEGQRGFREALGKYLPGEFFSIDPSSPILFPSNDGCCFSHLKNHLDALALQKAETTVAVGDDFADPSSPSAVTLLHAIRSNPYDLELLGLTYSGLCEASKVRHDVLCEREKDLKQKLIPLQVQPISQGTYLLK